MVTLRNSSDYGIDYFATCENKTPCVLDVVSLTCPLSSNRDKVQVFISGAFHGDEQYGPHISLYLIELLASNYDKDPIITQLLKTREIIILPITNPSGFYNNEREERVIINGQLSLIDMNRDFPYNNSPEECMNTLGARLIYKLFQQNLFVSAITFHGGTNVVSYPWGSINHLQGPRDEAAEAPDHIALDLLGQSMVEAAGDSIYVQQARETIPKYILGDMTSTVYPVDGSFEDWAYAAGWDTTNDAAFKLCKPTTYPLPSDFMDADISHVRTAVYLIETDNSKKVQQSKMGGRKIIDAQNGNYQVDLDSIYNSSSKDQYDG